MEGPTVQLRSLPLVRGRHGRHPVFSFVNNDMDGLLLLFFTSVETVSRCVYEALPLLLIPISYIVTSLAFGLCYSVAFVFALYLSFRRIFSVGCCLMVDSATSCAGPPQGNPQKARESPRRLKALYRDWQPGILARDYFRSVEPTLTHRSSLEAACS